jgi:hypothetical protein
LPQGLNGLPKNPQSEAIAVRGWAEPCNSFLFRGVYSLRFNGYQAAVLKAAGGRIVFHFHTRDLHLMLGPSPDGKPIRFRVTVDGHAPLENHGVDTDADGNGIVKDHRLYQLVRQKGRLRTILLLSSLKIRECRLLRSPLDERNRGKEDE